MITTFSGPQKKPYQHSIKWLAQIRLQIGTYYRMTSLFIHVIRKMHMDNKI